MKRLLASVMLSAALVVGVATSAFAEPECSPGQHGNPAPAFQPAVCDK